MARTTPRLALKDLLRRRKLTLSQFLSEFGITTYRSLLEKCSWFGVQEPSELEFNAARGPIVTNPADGVVVIEPQFDVDESDVEEKIVEESVEEQTVVIKKRKKRTTTVVDEG